MQNSSGDRSRLLLSALPSFYCYQLHNAVQGLPLPIWARNDVPHTAFEGRGTTPALFSQLQQSVTKTLLAPVPRLNSVAASSWAAPVPAQVWADQIKKAQTLT